MDNLKSKTLIDARGNAIYGDYVLTPCPNAFNDKTSYWLSKKGCAIAVYCFTPLSKADKRELSLENIQQNIEATIPLLEARLKEGASP